MTLSAKSRRGGLSPSARPWPHTSANLKARDAGMENAKWLRYHLTPALMSKPVAMLTQREVRALRDSLIDKVPKRSTVNRFMRAFKACLTLAANDSASRTGRRGSSRRYATRPTRATSSSLSCKCATWSPRATERAAIGSGSTSRRWRRPAYGWFRRGGSRSLISKPIIPTARAS